MNVTAYDTEGHRLVRLTAVSCFDAWPCLQAALAARFECDRDDLRLREDGAGNESLILRGAVVGRVTTEIAGLTFGASPRSGGNSAPRQPRAAEP